MVEKESINVYTEIAETDFLGGDVVEHRILGQGVVVGQFEPNPEGNVHIHFYNNNIGQCFVAPLKRYKGKILTMLKLITRRDDRV